MDFAAGIDQSKSPTARRIRRHSTVTILLVTVVVSFSFNSQVYSQVVEFAHEPSLASFSTTEPSGSLQQSNDSETDETKAKKESSKEDESRRKDEKNKAQNFLPSQRPIGQVSIDLRPKPKNGSTVVPENLVDESMPTSSVYASTADEMQAKMLFPVTRNHDELFAYQPLYFEEVNLERYGRTCGHLQPAVSTLRFFGTIPLLPYAMTAHHPSCTLTRRWPYAAGWGAPKVRELEPLQLKPSLVQAGAITGLAFLLP